MEIEYKNQKVRDVCTPKSKSHIKLPVDVQKKLQSTLNVISSAESLRDVVNYRPFRFHNLSGNLRGYYAIDLGRRLGYRLLVVPINDDGTECKDNSVVFDGTKSIGIKIIKVDEVSNHYE